ncbi:MAG: Ftsk/spoiiie family protein [Candidatus Curtissbacteria bacterium GW2011_GWC1_44_33]|uniref:Ftsk/spoiiie family protein n=1 Tax=Candidatus Curtissbacteria bacterium GW2011_GWC1_44_33 TaxID=1618413 RepID=A0A0G1M2I6_9BACT|nr:MAG: Ftsk/spoiiie family protein [Candidatus Curtissbacteria bacterium GW2011_GWC1_44_33]
MVEVNLGPAVTQYALEVALGTKLSKITALERDLALALAAPTGTIRIEAPIPGRSLVGIELPNRSPEFVPLKKMMESDAMREHASKLAVSLGLDVSGKPIVTEIGRMPHVLIAGQTGSGKSVCINSFLASILFRATPSEVKFILVDPKRVELTGYNGVPHLLSPVIVDPERVISALRWILSEMDRRYKLFAQAGARNIDGYNEMSGFQALPYIVLLIDELADIMLFSPVEVEDAITRIAQMSRATGIHMVLATQRPSVDVITGLIKANIPCRIAFAVSSQVDSRVILDTQGAEKLLGRGDMLYLPPEQAKPVRIQGSFISDKEINALVSFLKNQGVTPQYTEEVTTMTKSGLAPVAGLAEVDPLFAGAVREVCQYDRASASLLQRRLSIGYARAARIIDQLEATGVVGPAEGSKPREVIGRAIKEARTKKRYSLSKLEDVTKIKKDFIEALEKENWQDTPDFPVLVGFVKSIAGALGTSEKSLLALLRRDYPPKALSINPKPDVGNKFVWSPKLTFALGVGIIVVLLLGYLIFQYGTFVAPPSLSVSEPKEGQVITQRLVRVSGKTDSDAIIKINNQPVLLDSEGNFVAEIEIFEGTSEIEVKAQSRAGKETVVRRKIKPEL